MLCMISLRFTPCTKIIATCNMRESAGKKLRYFYLCARAQSSLPEKSKNIIRIHCHVVVAADDIRFINAPCSTIYNFILFITQHFVYQMRRGTQR